LFSSNSISPTDDDSLLCSENFNTTIESPTTQSQLYIEQEKVVLTHVNDFLHHVLAVVQRMETISYSNLHSMDVENTEQNVVNTLAQTAAINAVQAIQRANMETIPEEEI
jgi:hypothetical protein